MRVAVISDIHGNLAALEATLAALEDERPDAIWCLGDLVGYGPRPNECCARVAEIADVCLIGNHDLGVLEEIALDEFSFEAAASARWTQGSWTSRRETTSQAFRRQRRSPTWGPSSITRARAIRCGSTSSTRGR